MEKTCSLFVSLDLLTPVSYVMFSLEFYANLTVLFPPLSLSCFFHGKCKMKNGGARKDDSTENEKIGER